MEPGAAGRDAVPEVDREGAVGKIQVERAARREDPQKSREERHASTDELRQHISEALGAMDTGATRNEAKRVVIVIGAIVLVVGVLLYFLSR